MEIIKTLKSYEEFLEQALSPREVGGRSSRDNENGWAGASWEGAVKLAQAGWAEGSREIETLAKDIRVSLGDKLKLAEPRHDVTGAYVDIARYLEGDPENMIDFEMVESNRIKVVKIVVSASVSYNYSAEQITNRGAAVLALTDLLNQANIDTEISLDDTLKSSSNLYSVQFPIKYAGEHVDPDRLAFVLAHPAMNRRIIFSYEEQEPDDVRRTFGFRCGSGYGEPYKTPEGRRGDLYIHPMRHDMEDGRAFDSKASAKAWVIKQLKQQGVELEA